MFADLGTRLSEAYYKRQEILELEGQVQRAKEELFVIENGIDRDLEQRYYKVLWVKRHCSACDGLSFEEVSAKLDKEEADIFRDTRDALGHL